MSAFDLLLLSIIAVPAIGLTVAGVLLILRRTRFTETGSIVALVLGILSISFGIALALALIFVMTNLGSEVVGGTAEFGTSGGNAIGPTLGEKLFSEVVGRRGQDYGGRRALDINMRETIEGISVTVDRAYFDSNRVGVEYTVTGLPQSLSMSQLLPKGSRLFQPEAALMDAGDPRVRFRSAGGSGVRADSQINGMEVPSDTTKGVVGFDVTRAQANASGMRLLFVVSVVESVHDGNVFRQERAIGPFEFHIEVPFVPSTETRAIKVGSTVEVSGVSVKLEEVTITPAEVTALIRVDRSPEQRLAGLRPRRVALVVPGEWPSDRPKPSAYVVTTLGDVPDNFLARFNPNWEVKPGEWRLKVEYFTGHDDLDEGLKGPWIFDFQVP